MPLMPVVGAAARRRIEDWLRRTRDAAKPGTVTLLPGDGADGAGWWVLSGAGETPRPPLWRVEHSLGAAVRACDSRQIQVLEASLGMGEGEPASVARRLAFAAVLAGGWPDKPQQKVPRRGTLRLELVGAEGREVSRSAAAGAGEAEALLEVVELANRPGNEAPPSVIARETSRICRRHGLRCRVHDHRALQRAGCGALLAVGRGSAHPPCLIEIEYRGRGAGRRPLALVGKTITFDSGGLSLKPWKGMQMMRYDKSGGMAVLGAMVLAAVRRLPLWVTGWLPVAENMPDGAAVRPGDVLRTRAGLTVEVVSTDAEGRLILADAIAMAADRRPEVIVDIATLTGAVVVALGHHAAAVLGNDDGLIAALRAAGEECGERLWPLPLWPEYDGALASEFADLANSDAGEHGAGTILGAVFLKRFVPEGVRWAHLDVAGTARDSAGAAHRRAGATLFGARLLAEWLTRHHDASTRS
ncbi:MAG: leucyl aminopeptidase family protein [Kiritimatiellae bacterium]|nr:leucyl aminopeptidase family protein [Kiritimatiellia bacterium]